MYNVKIRQMTFNLVSWICVDLIIECSSLYYASTVFVSLVFQRIEMLNQQTDAFKEETVGKQQRLQYLRTKYPAVNVKDH